MKESQVEAAIVAYAKSKGVSTLKLAGPNAKGQADRLFMRNGVAAFLEVKRPGGKPTALQLKFLRERNDDGFAAAWVDTVTKGQAFIDTVFP